MGYNHYSQRLQYPVTQDGHPKSYQISLTERLRQESARFQRKMGLRRQSQPEKNDYFYTHHHTTGKSIKRLDYIWINSRLLDYQPQIRTKTCAISDHRYVILKLKQRDIQRRGLWRHNDTFNDIDEYRQISDWWSPNVNLNSSQETDRIGSRGITYVNK